MLPGRPLSRRSLVAAALTVLPGARPARAQHSERAIRLLCWPEYDHPAILDRLEEELGVDVQVQYLRAADEAVTFLRAMPGGVDLVTATDGLVAALARAGLIQPIDLGQLPNAGGLFPHFQMPSWTLIDGVVYGLPVSWRTSPLVYDAAELAQPPARWLDLDDEQLRGTIVFADDAVAHFLVWNRALGADDPARVTKGRLEETTNFLHSLKRRLALSFVDTAAAVAAELAGAGRVASVGAESIPGLAPDADLRLTRPEPGDFAACDCFCIAAGTGDLEAVYAFLDGMISAETQATIANELRRGVVTASGAGSIAEPALGLFDYANLDSVFARSPFYGYPPLVVDAGATASYLDWVLAWDRIRFAPLEAFAPPSTPTPVPAESPTGAPN